MSLSSKPFAGFANHRLTLAGKKTKERKRNFIIFLCFCVASIIGFALSLVKLYSYPPYSLSEDLYINIPIRNEIERALEVKGLENKFIYVEFRTGYRSAAGAGAGGLGAPQILVKDAKQFVELIPMNEPVYAAVLRGKRADGSDDPYIVQKIYFSGIENRALIIVYEDNYQYSDTDKDGFKRGWSVKSLNNEQVVFWTNDYPDPNKSVFAYTAVVWFISFIVFLILTMMNKPDGFEN